MPKKISRLTLHVVLFLWTGILSAASADDFYIQRLRAGVEAYGRGSPVVAAEEFRIACFGFLEQPVLLEEGLARLALAQLKTGRLPEADEALSRFAEVELRFGKFKDAALEPPVRADFVDLARKRLSPERFRSLSALAGAPPAKEAPVGRAAPDPTVTVAITGGAGSAGSSADVALIWQLITDRKRAEAWRLARELVGKGSAGRELLKAALAAAVLSSDFEGGLRVAKALEPFNTGEEVSMFYAGVAYSETGSTAVAAELFRISGPLVAETPWVKYYMKKVPGK